MEGTDLPDEMVSQSHDSHDITHMHTCKCFLHSIVIMRNPETIDSPCVYMQHEVALFHVASCALVIKQLCPGNEGRILLVWRVMYVWCMVNGCYT